MTIHDMVAAAVFGAAVVATLLDEWYGVHDLASLRTVRAFLWLQQAMRRLFSLSANRTTVEDYDDDDGGDEDPTETPRPGWVDHHDIKEDHEMKWNLHRPQANYLTIHNLFSNEISVEDFEQEYMASEWMIDSQEITPPIFFILRKLVQHQGIAFPAAYFIHPPAEDTVYFHRQRFDFTTDFDALCEAALVFCDFNYQHLDTDPYTYLYCEVPLLRYYAKAKYPIILRERKMALAFLSTINYPESPSYALGQKEMSGVLQHILSFAVSGENCGEEFPVLAGDIY